MIEQILYVVADVIPFGVITLAGDQFESYFVSAQFALIGFLFCMISACFLLSFAFRQKQETDFSRVVLQLNARLSMTIVWACFLVGLVSTAFLAYRFYQIGGFRSQLVKSSDGAVLTALAFYGNFAFTVLLFNFFYKRKFVYAVLIAAAFGFAVLMTGSRGRLLWPIVLAVGLYVSTFRSLPTVRILFAGIGAFLLLAIMDPLRKSFFDPTYQFSIADALTSFGNSRNFDGFANFMLIYFGSSDFSLEILLNGARETFMMKFFPEVYLSGVGFGSTIPGYFYLSAGLTGLLFGGFVYGGLLYLLGSTIRKTQSIWLIFGYLALIPWIAAVGGDLVESTDKMLIAASPSIMIIFVAGVLRPIFRVHNPHPS